MAKVIELTPSALAASAFGFIAYGAVGRIDGFHSMSWSIALSVFAVTALAFAMQVGLPVLAGRVAAELDDERLRRRLAREPVTLRYVTRTALPPQADRPAAAANSAKPKAVGAQSSRRRHAARRRAAAAAAGASPEVASA